MCIYTINSADGVISCHSCYLSKHTMTIMCLFPHSFLPANFVSVDSIFPRHSPAKTLHIAIEACSSRSIQTIADIIARLPDVTYLDIKITCDVPFPVTLAPPFTIRALAYHTSLPAGLDIIHQFASHATHIAARITDLSHSPVLPSISFLIIIFTPNTAHLFNTIPDLIRQFPLLQGLAVGYINTRQIDTPIPISHPTLRYIHPRIAIAPKYFLPQLCIGPKFPPVPFRPSTSYLHICHLGRLLASFFLATHRIASDIDPFVVARIPHHLTSYDGVCGPETTLYGQYVSDSDTDTDTDTDY